MPECENSLHVQMVDNCMAETENRLYAFVFTFLDRNSDELAQMMHTYIANGACTLDCTSCMPTVTCLRPQVA